VSLPPQVLQKKYGLGLALVGLVDCIHGFQLPFFLVPVFGLHSHLQTLIQNTAHVSVDLSKQQQVLRIFHTNHILKSTSTYQLITNLGWKIPSDFNAAMYEVHG
jgi:hypothetical protein